MVAVQRGMRTFAVAVLAVLTLTACSTASSAPEPSAHGGAGAAPSAGARADTNTDTDTAPNAGVRAAPPAKAKAAAEAGPDIVDVTCTPRGTRVSSRRVAARPDGVHVRVRDTSGAEDVYVNFQHDAGGGGGDPVPARGTVMVRDIPPGAATVNCSSGDGKEDRRVAVEVLDPAGSWRTGGLAALGCDPPQVSIIDWVYSPGVGRTADAALRDLARQIGSPITWQHAPEGYVGAARQTYVIEKLGRPWTSALVQLDRGHHYASLGDFCSKG